MWTPRKARGPTEEYEEDREKEIRLGKWDYVGGKGMKERGEERRNIRIEIEGDRWSGYEPQRNRKERRRMEKRVEGPSRQIGRRNSERENRWVGGEKNTYPIKNRIEAIVIHKAEQTE